MYTFFFSMYFVDSGENVVHPVIYRKQHVSNVVKQKKKKNN